MTSLLRWAMPALLALLANGQTRWTEQQANDWYKQQPWLVGANYIPANAINELEMWQADTFDPQQIEKELGWASSIGMNTMRVFLHDLLWDADPDGYRKRMDEFLTIASKHGIATMFVLFDSCWDPKPQLGKQRAPQPGIHNSGWVQSPGAKALRDPSQYPRLEKYVKEVVAAFANDKRVIAWDIWNEPDNAATAYGKIQPDNKEELVLALLPKAFAWARTSNPSQPLTSGVWKKEGDWSSNEKLTPMERAQIDNSDVISFHNYEKSGSFKKRVKQLQRYNRPILCTEYMARGAKSTFKGSMPAAKKNKVAAYNWGLVAGKSQTNLPWDSWQKPYVDREPKVWFHEIFYSDGRPYKQKEVDFIREMTGKSGTAGTF